MLMGIAIGEKEYRKLTTEQKLRLLDDAYFRAKQNRLSAENYVERLELLHCPRECANEVLTQRQAVLVKLLDEGYLD